MCHKGKTNTDIEKMSQDFDVLANRSLGYFDGNSNY